MMLWLIGAIAITVGGAVIFAIRDSRLDESWKDRRAKGGLGLVLVAPFIGVATVAILMVGLVRELWSNSRSRFHDWIWKRGYGVLPASDISAFVATPAHDNRSWRDLTPAEQRRAHEEEKLLAAPINWWPWAPIVGATIVMVILGIWLGS